MNWMDAVIIVLMIMGFIHGVIKGAIQEIFVALALVVGVIAAGKIASALDDITSQLSHPTAAKVFAFALAFLLVAIAIGLFGKMFSGLAKAANLRMIDRALGALAPEVEALLAEHLERDAAAADVARQWDETVGLARRTLAAVPVGSVPPFSQKAIRAGRRSVGRLLGAAAVAASLLLGVGLGAWLFGGPADPPPVGHRASPSDVAGGTLPIDEATIVGTSSEGENDGRSRIWSWSRLRPRATDRRRSSLGLVWTSPLQRPKLEKR